MNGVNDYRQVFSRYHLLPHEAWFALRILKRQESHPKTIIRRIQQNYGPEGVVLVMASLATTIAGLLIDVIGGVLLGLYYHGTVHVIVVSSVIGEVLLGSALSAIRYGQAVYARGQFHNDNINQTPQSPYPS